MSGNPTPANGRVNVGRVDHVALVYRNLTNLEAARQKFSELLGIDDWDDMGEVFGRVHVVISWQGGIELICPTKPDPVFDHHLATRGEGFFSLIFGVADLDQAVARLANIGVAAPFHPPPPSIRRRRQWSARSSRWPAKRPWAR